MKIQKRNGAFLSPITLKKGFRVAAFFLELQRAYSNSIDISSDNYPAPKNLANLTF
jgi:hypothetical protein